MNKITHAVKVTFNKFYENKTEILYLGNEEQCNNKFKEFIEESKNKEKYEIMLLSYAYLHYDSIDGKVIYFISLMTINQLNIIILQDET